MAGMRSAMRSPMRSALDQALGTAYMSLTNQALAILRKFGTDAHVYLPGANGVAVSGLLSNNYTLSDGGTGYSAVDGTAGLVLDAAGSVGAELNPDPGFNTPGGWSVTNAAWVVSGGVATATALPDGQSVFRSGVVTVGNTYAVSFDIVSITSGGILPSIGGAFTGAFTTVGTKTAIITATSNTNINLISSGVTNCVVDNFSVKQVTGIHATQATTANKPALRRGLYNLAYPSDPSHVDWAKVGATPVTGGIQEDTSGGTHRTQRNITIPSGSPVTARVKLLSTTRNAQLELGGGTGGASVTFGLSGAGSVLVAAATYGTGWTVQAATIRLDSVDGYCECVLSATPNSGVTSVVSYLYMTSGSSAAYTGNGTSTLLTKEFGLFAGTLTASQILAEGGIPLTTSAAASNPSAGRYSWQFDGSNDSLALVGANTGAQGVMIGAFRPNKAHFGAVFCSGGDTVGNPGCGIGVDSSSRASFLFGDGTTTNERINSGATTIVGAAHVISAVWGAASQKLRVDGNEVGSRAESVVPVSSGGISIGHISASGDYFSGEVGPLIFINGTVSDADLLTLERWVAANTLGAPSF